MTRAYFLVFHIFVYLGAVNRTLLTSAMPSVHLFFPENDLALATDVANYTPPEAAVRLRRAGDVLPLWYASPGDCFCCSGVNDRWLSSMQERFRIDVDVFPYDFSGKFMPAPWGWSKASRGYFRQLGFPEVLLPGDTSLEAIRNLSHRRTASGLIEKLSERISFPIASPAVELRTQEDIEGFVALVGDAVFKAPWSSSGRGLVRVDHPTLARYIRQLCGTVRRQGSVMAERYHAVKLCDFAMLFNMAGDECSAAGFSLFSTTGMGVYTGNMLMPDGSILNRLGEHYSRENLLILQDAIGGVLRDVIGEAYSGPLGVDMMLVEEDGDVMPVIAELNLRMTMGHVARRFCDRYVAGGASGIYSVLPANSAHTSSSEFSTFNGRLVSGTIDLVPPNPHFIFRAEVK